MPSLTINNFKGMTTNQNLWSAGYSSYNTCVDFWGLGDNINYLSYPGVVQRAMCLSAMSVNVPLSSVMSDFAYYPTQSQVYGADSSSTGNIWYYKVATAEWTVSATAGASYRIRNVTPYNGELFFTSATSTAGTANGALSKINGTTLTHGTQTGLYTADPMPMKVFNGSLYVANWRYVDKYDGTTYVKQKLTLPTDFTIRSMEVAGEYLYIVADNEFSSSLFVWDGTSPTYNTASPINSEKYAPQMIYSGGILWLVANRGTATNQSTIQTPIYVHENGNVQEVMRLPLSRPTTPIGMQLASYQDGILIGSDENGTANYENGVGGAWFIRKNQTTGNYEAGILAHHLSNPTDMSMGAIFSSGNTQTGTTTPAVYVSYYDSSNTVYYIKRFAPPNVSPNNDGISLWQSLPIDAGSTNKKRWESIKLDFKNLNTGQNVQVSYRLDHDSTFTTLKYFYATDPATDFQRAIPIRRTGKNITIRITLNQNASTDSSRLYAFTLYYDNHAR